MLCQQTGLLTYREIFVETRHGESTAKPVATKVLREAVAFLLKLKS